jgi:hypothetical protein
MDKVLKPSDCYASSSEPFRFYRVRQKDLPYLERALWELWWGYGGVGGIDR